MQLLICSLSQHAHGNLPCCRKFGCKGLQQGPLQPHCQQNILQGATGASISITDSDWQF